LSDNLLVGIRNLFTLGNVPEFNENVDSIHGVGERWQGVDDIHELHQGVFDRRSREVEAQCVIQTNGFKR
jgi:hypothetical protein